MKRFYLTSILTLLAVISILGQDLQDGYYRVRNFGTKRYIYITDNTGGYSVSTDVGDFGALQLWTGEERPITDPASIIYVDRQSNGQYDLKGQGLEIYALVKRYVDIKLVTSGAFKDTYTVYASAYGITKYLCDVETSTRPQQGYIGTTRQAPYRNWEALPVSAGGDSYMGIKPTVQIGDKFYYPFYATFPFNLYSEGMKAYTISQVDTELNMAVLKEVSGMIPAKTPVLIECSSDQSTNNRLDLKVSADSPLAENLLAGVLYCNSERPKSKDALTPFDSQTMRVLGMTAEGKLGFVSSSNQLYNYKKVDYLPANQAYLPVSAGTAEELTIVTEEEYQQALANKTYTLTYLVDGEVYNTSTLKAGEEITPIKNPEKEGYTFSGWTDMPNTMPAENITVQGTFTVNSYTLTYLVDGEVYKVETIEYGSQLTAIAEPEKEGYTFNGWSELPTTMPAGDVNIEGTFTINSYTLTYIIDGEVYQTQSIEYGSEIVPIEAPDKEGYEFKGWTDLPGTMPAHDVVVEGSYKLLDGIATVSAAKGSKQEIYDILGRRVSAAQKKGLYIIGGKKILKK